MLRVIRRILRVPYFATELNNSPKRTLAEHIALHIIQGLLPKPLTKQVNHCGQKLLLPQI